MPCCACFSTTCTRYSCRTSGSCRIFMVLLGRVSGAYSCFRDAESLFIVINTDKIEISLRCGASGASATHEWIKDGAARWCHKLAQVGHKLRWLHGRMRVGAFAHTFIAFFLGRLGAVEKPRRAAAVAMLIGRTAAATQESSLTLTIVSFDVALHRAGRRNREEFHDFIAAVMNQVGRPPTGRVNHGWLISGLFRHAPRLTVDVFRALAAVHRAQLRCVGFGINRYAGVVDVDRTSAVLENILHRGAIEWLAGDDDRFPCWFERRAPAFPLLGV